MFYFSFFTLYLFPDIELNAHYKKLEWYPPKKYKKTRQDKGCVIPPTMNTGYSPKSCRNARSGSGYKHHCALQYICQVPGMCEHVRLCFTWLDRHPGQGESSHPRRRVTGWQKGELLGCLPEFGCPPTLSMAGGRGPPTSDNASEEVSGFGRLSPGVGVLPSSPLCPTLSACSHFCRASSNSSMPEHR